MRQHDKKLRAQPSNLQALQIQSRSGFIIAVDPKPKWSRKTILLNFVIVAVVFIIGYTLGYRQGQRTLILDAAEMQALGLTNVNVVPQRIVDQ